MKIFNSKKVENENVDFSQYNSSSNKSIEMKKKPIEYEN